MLRDEKPTKIVLKSRDHFEEDEAEEGGKDEEEGVIHEHKEARGTMVPLLVLGLAEFIQCHQFRL